LPAATALAINRIESAKVIISCRLCIALMLLIHVTAAPASVVAQQKTSVGVAALAIDYRATQHVGDSAPPLIRAPSWWPDKTTHQNVAALLVAGTVGIAVVWALPESLTKWDKSTPVLESLKRAYTRAPIWDEDPWAWNYVVHPVTGSWVYLMERNHGRSMMRGFLLSTAASVGWEYGFEAPVEHPSIQDLIITSTAGTLLGELSHRITTGMRRNGFNGVERIVLTLINPAYVVNRQYR
jgi:hypothetical protein